MSAQLALTATLVRLVNDAAIALFRGATSGEMNRALSSKGNNGVEKATQARMGCDINNTLSCIPETKTTERWWHYCAAVKNMRSLDNSYYTQGQEGRLS